MLILHLRHLKNNHWCAISKFFIGGEREPLLPTDWATVCSCIGFQCEMTVQLHPIQLQMSLFWGWGLSVGHCTSAKEVLLFLLLLRCVPITGLVVARRVDRGIALLFHDYGTRRRWVVRSTPRLYFTPGKDPVPIVQQAGWVPWPVWMGRKSRPTGIRYPNCPAHSQSLYRLSYPADLNETQGYIMCKRVSGSWSHRDI